jgi:hypothetical protein
MSHPTLTDRLLVLAALLLAASLPIIGVLHYRHTGTAPLTTNVYCGEVC